MKTLFISILLILFSFSVWSKGIAVEGARLWAAPDNTRVVFDISGPVQHELFTLSKPERIVLDLSNSKLAGEISGLDFKQGVVSGIRTAIRDVNDLRIVLDLKKNSSPRSFVLKPNEKYGYRLVIDLPEQTKGGKRPVKTVVDRPNNVLRDVVIAIDAGHGGEDPGASGFKGTKEKVVVLAIARRLEKLIAAEPGMEPLMIRDGDYYIGLRKRTQIARANKADMFLSIHADAFHDRRARGASVYTLSKKGAGTESARWLAERENAADFIGGVSLADKDDLLAEVLLDLSMVGTIEASLDLANTVIGELKEFGRVHRRTPGQAGFVVLKSPDIPSVLVETAFISNPQEERNLRSARHQKKLAKTLFNGIKNYFYSNAPPGTLLAGRHHVIAQGDTLSEIARRYQVPLDHLRGANGLRHDRLQVGKVLLIPYKGG